jgi:phospholipid/cholesterol/gamma-HCH transport system substrate-binding protein
MGKDSYALISGLFVAVLITGIVTIIIWLGDVQSQTKTYVAETRDSVTGLNVGSTVFYRGIAVGKVNAVRFSPDNPDMIIVPMEIESDVRLNRGVYAILELQGVTGLTRISLKDGDHHAEPLPNDSETESRIPIKPSFIDRLSVSGEDTVNETRELMLRLNQLLNESNIRQMERILINIETATEEFSLLQDQAGKALVQVPALTADARRTLSEINDLSQDAKQLSSQMRQDLAALSQQSSELMQTGVMVGQRLLQTTLPRADTIMLQMQTATRRFDRVAATLEADPQALVFGTANPLAPGEPGFRKLK